MIQRVIDCRVYLEGVSVPFHSVHVREAVGDVRTSCQIALAPSRAIKAIQHRTLVHVMVRRTSHAGGDSGYTCLFEGEVAVIGTSRSARGQRAFQVLAYGMSGYWEWAKLHYMDGGSASPTIAPGSAATEDYTFNQAMADDSLQVVSVTRTENQSGLVLTSSIHDALSGVPFGDGIRNLFKLAFEKGPQSFHYQFIIDANDRLKLSERLVVATANIGNFIKPEILSVYVQQLLAGAGGFIDLAEVMNVVMDATHHDFIAPAAPLRIGVSGASSARQQQAVRDVIASGASSSSIEELRAARSESTTGTKIGSYIVKPNCYFLPPPTCNIVFPNQYESESFGRSFHDEPTRMYFLTNPPRMNLSPGSGVGGRAYMQSRIAPSSKFIGNVPLVVNRNGKITDGGQLEFMTLEQVLDKRRFFGVEYSYLSEAELRGGINPVTLEWPMLATLLAEEQKRGGSDQGSLLPHGDDRWQSIADFMFWMQHYSVGRSQDVRCEFSPNLIAGFPVVTLDASQSGMHLVGYATVVEHDISASGIGTTSVQMALCRDVDEERPKFRSSGLPPWFDASVFADNVVGASFYADILGQGVGSLADHGSGEDGIASGASELASSFSKLHSADESGASAFVDALTSRPMVSDTEIMQFLGASKVNESRFDGGALDQGRMQVVLDHVAELAFGAQGA